MRFADVIAFWERFAASSRGQWVMKIMRWLMLVAIIGFLAYKLTEIGWGEIWTALPTHPLFYILFVLIYFSIPLTEVLIYRVTWTFDAWRSIPAFVKKRIYNKDVLGYSGEVYFFAWARKHLGLKDAEILETIRDNNIISSAASTLIALGMLGVFLFVGEIRLTELFGDNLVWYAAGAVAVLGIVIPLGIRFKRYLFSMAAKTALLIFGIQCVRVIGGQVLQIGQWSVVMPEVPISVWFTFAAVGIIISRVPLIPNQNLIFMGAGVQLSGMMDISTAAVAGMLLVVNVLDKVMNLGLFGLITVFEPKAPATNSEKTTEEALQADVETDVQKKEISAASPA